MNGYRFELCTDNNIWNLFVEQSPQGTLFSKSSFVDALQVKYSNYFVKKGMEIVGGVTVLENENKEALTAPYSYTPYQGIIFKDFSKQATHKKNLEEFRITEFVITELSKIYTSISLCHSPFLRDIRPFSWFNYHEPLKGRFKISVYYTAMLDLSFSNSEEFLDSIRTVRRQEYKKKIECNIYETNDIELLNHLHAKTFARQNIKKSDLETSLLTSIYEKAIKEAFGRLSVCQIQGSPASAILLLFDSKRGYYMFGANDPDFRDAAASTKLLIDNILYTKFEKNLPQFDFLGCNSPNRGDYKLSFNPSLYPYFLTEIE